MRCGIIEGVSVGIRCLFGHRYSVVHPNVSMVMKFGYLYAGTYAICERCRKRIDSPKEGLPFMPYNI